MKRGWALIIGGIGLGAGAMYLLDPDRGRRRRAYLRDQAGHARRVLADTVETAGRDLGNRARGAAAEVRSRVRREPTPDEKLVARVRSEMGHVTSHAHAVRVEARDGQVTLSGPVLESEFARLVKTVSQVPGVRAVETRLEVYEDAGNIPGLQGGTRPAPRGALWAMAQENWTPASRLLAGAAGGSLMLYGAARRDMPGAALGAAGFGLLARSVANRRLGRLIETAPRSSAAQFHTTIDIAAPPEDVSAFCTHWENYAAFWPEVREVTEAGNGRIHWVIDGPAGRALHWNEQLTEVVPNERIRWQNAPGAAIRYEGLMEFQRLPDGGTHVEVRVWCSPLTALVGRAAAALLGVNSKQRVDRDLERLKSLIESATQNPPCEEPAPERQAA